MRQDIKEKWISALRSGEYAQTTSGYLRYENSFCCLGVLCDIVKDDLGIEWVQSTTDDDDSGKIYEFDNRVSILPNSVQKLAILTDSPHCNFFNLDGYVVHTSLAHLNDIGKTFSQIAHILETQDII